MEIRNIVYFDKAPLEFVKIMEDAAPAGYKVWCWDNMSEEEQNAVWPIIDYFLILSRPATRELMACAPRLRLVQRTGIGYTNVDAVAAKERNIPVAVIPGGNSVAVAEHTMLLILAVYRHLTELSLLTKQGQWPNFKFRLSSRNLQGKTLGLLGFGAIGREVAKRARAFDANVVYYDPFRATPQVEAASNVTYMEFEEVLRCADVVSLHMPLVESTKNIIAKPQLEMMKDGAILINTARGGLVCEADLFEALASGKLAGAGLDSMVGEPVQEVRPIYSLENVIVTPHAAAANLDNFDHCVRLAIENIVMADQTGQPKNVVNGVELLPTIAP